MTKKENEMMEKNLKKITEHFGVDTELMKLSEEVGELQGICYKELYDSLANHIDDIEEECADVLVVLLQIFLAFNVDMDKVVKTVEHKVDRTIKRIEEGWYDKHR